MLEWNRIQPLKSENCIYKIFSFYDMTSRTMHSCGLIKGTCGQYSDITMNCK